MIDTREEIERHLSVLDGLKVSAVHHAADMLTVQFGTLQAVTNLRGAVKYVGEWALHVQCSWRIERAGSIVATQDDLVGPDEKAHRTAERLDELLAGQGPIAVTGVSGSETGGVCILLSKNLRLVIEPDGTAGDEDWRFFGPTSDAKHFVIEGGKVAP